MFVSVEIGVNTCWVDVDAIEDRSPGEEQEENTKTINGTIVNIFIFIAIFLRFICP